ncbi:MAG: hypothetical protein WKI04_02775 [Ferruginibacter sp.]
MNPAGLNDPLFSYVAEDEPGNSKFVIKVEEQQSGKKQTNIYYFELNNKQGAETLKPLIMLNRIKSRTKKLKIPSLPDSLDNLIRPAKKRTTT